MKIEQHPVMFQPVAKAFDREFKAAVGAKGAPLTMSEIDSLYINALEEVLGKEIAAKEEKRIARTKESLQL